MVQALCKEAVKAAIPTTYRYLLWSAGNKKSLFNDENEQKKSKKGHKYRVAEDNKPQYYSYLSHQFSLEAGTRCGAY